MDFSISFVTMTAARIISVTMIIFWCGFKYIVSGFEPMNPVESIICVVILGATIIAWRWRGAGGLIFIGLALLYIILTWPEFSMLTYAIAVLPMVLSGSLFVISKYTT
jgi:hypothetical protein